ncbi:MAG TPA: hypothetical protein PK033_15650 [Acetivibrio sp.]|jgi:hypothetical protein|nr:hypothetical protein [Clostridium sp.]HOQ02175.1 hypothetical protein [Acetivibrio clariflavus]HQA59291.1 hypothetical protein [Acetivibrio sp.]
MKDIVQIFTCERYVAGLKKDGTVVSVQKPYFENFNLNNFTNIVQINGDYYIAGLKEDGTVVAVGLFDPKESMIFKISLGVKSYVEDFTPVLLYKRN